MSAPTPTPSLVRTTLLTARARLFDPSRWCQGKWQDNTDQVCLLEAIRRAASSAETYDEAVYALGFESEYAVALWNDQHSHAEVIAAIDKAIALESA